MSTSLDGVLVHCSFVLPVPIYTLCGERGTARVKCLAKDTTQCPRPRLKPELLDLEMSSLTMRPLASQLF